MERLVLAWTEGVYFCTVYKHSLDYARLESLCFHTFSVWRVWHSVGRRPVCSWFVSLNEQDILCPDYQSPKQRRPSASCVVLCGLSDRSEWYYSAKLCSVATAENLFPGRFFQREYRFPHPKEQWLPSVYSLGHLFSVLFALLSMRLSIS